MSTPAGTAATQAAAPGLLDLSPEALVMLPPAQGDAAAAPYTADASAAADTPPGAAVGGGGGSVAGGGSPSETGVVQLHPSIAVLRDNPAVIKRILEQAPTVQASTLALDEQADGSLDGALSTGSPPGTTERLKSISVIRTPNPEGIKNVGVDTPRPSCKWYAPSLAIIQFPPESSATAAPMAAGTPPPDLRTYKMDPSARVPSWKMNGRKVENYANVEGLCRWSFTPGGTDQAYIDGHRMTLYLLRRIFLWGGDQLCIGILYFFED